MNSALYASVVVDNQRWDGQGWFQKIEVRFSENLPSLIHNIPANGATIDVPTDVRSIGCRAVKPHSWLSQVGNVVEGSENCNCEKRREILISECDSAKDWSVKTNKSGIWKLIEGHMEKQEVEVEMEMEREMETEMEFLNSSDKSLDWTTGLT